MSQKSKNTQESQESQQPQTVREIQVVSSPVVVPVAPVAQAQQPKKKKSHPFSKFFSLIVMLCLVVGFFLPVYLQANKQTASGSIFCGDQTLFAFAADALTPLITGKSSLTAFLSAVMDKHVIWGLIGCIVVVFFLTVITLFSKKHTRGWFFLTCVFAMAAGFQYIKKLNLISAAQTIIKDASLKAFPGADLIMVGACFAALFAFVMALFCGLRALFSSKKRSVFAVFAFLVSVAMLGYTFSDKTLGIVYSIQYYGKIPFTLATTKQLTIVLTEALPLAATMMFFLNAAVEAVRVANGYKVGAFTVFRYLILAAVVVIGWAYPVFIASSAKISLTPALILAVVAVVLFILAIIASVHNGKKKTAAKVAAAKPQVIVTYVAAEAQAK